MVELTASRWDGDCTSSFGVYVFGAHDAAPSLSPEQREVFIATLDPSSSGGRS